MYQETISLEETVGNYIQAQTEAMWKDATAQPEDLFSFLMRYPFRQEVSEEERTTLFCQIVSLYESQFRISEEFGIYKTMNMLASIRYKGGSHNKNIHFSSFR